MIDVIECLAVIIATLIGAGFASGQEINTFFLNKGMVEFVRNRHS